MQDWLEGLDGCSEELRRPSRRSTAGPVCIHDNADPYMCTLSQSRRVLGVRHDPITSVPYLMPFTRSLDHPVRPSLRDKLKSIIIPGSSSGWQAPRVEEGESETWLLMRWGWWDDYEISVFRFHSRPCRSASPPLSIRQGQRREKGSLGRERQAGRAKCSNRDSSWLFDMKGSWAEWSDSTLLFACLSLSSVPVPTRALNFHSRPFHIKSPLLVSRLLSISHDTN